MLLKTRNVQANLDSLLRYYYYFLCVVSISSCLNVKGVLTSFVINIKVRAITRKVCLPLEEDSFRPILHHYDGPKFRLELSVPEVLFYSSSVHNSNLSLLPLVF